MFRFPGGEVVVGDLDPGQVTSEAVGAVRDFDFQNEIFLLLAINLIEVQADLLTGDDWLPSKHADRANAGIAEDFDADSLSDDGANAVNFIGEDGRELIRLIDEGVASIAFFREFGH